MFRLLGWLFLLLLLLPGRAPAQSAWPTTELDEEATVQMPYEATLDDEPLPAGCQLLKTSTSDNDFAVLRIDLRYTPGGYFPDAGISLPDLSKLYDKLARYYNRHTVKGKLVSQGDIVFAGRPARATLYRGFDQHYQLPIHIETIWVWSGDAFYQFVCSYALPETEGSQTDKRRFFTSVRFGKPDPGQKL